MKKVPIKLIELSEHGYLQIRPDVSVSGDFKSIYRDASGITWNETNQALVASDPDRWEPNKLFGQIICAAINEYGVKLEITDSTNWSTNISEVLKASLLKNAVDAYTMMRALN